jgi:hypothetical protein
MKILGRGWQYTAYDLENGRVLKRRNSKMTAYIEMLKSCFPYTKNPIWKFTDYYKAGTNEAKSSLNKILVSNLDKKLFGNPLILENGIDYEQDKIMPIRTYFRNNNNEENRKVVDAFIEFNKLLIQNNLIDKSFAIAKNFGLNEMGEIVLCDIGELWSSPENIREQIEKKVWRYGYVLKTLPNKELREYFVDQMNTEIKTGEIMEK